MATAKQIAARKLFAKRAKAGEFKRAGKRAAPRKANPHQFPTPAFTSSHGKFIVYARDDVYGYSVVKKSTGETVATRSKLPDAESIAQRMDDKARGKKNTGGRLTNPVKRAGLPAKKYVARPSQMTGRTPTKRLTERRKTNVKLGVPGYFPNPKGPKKKIWVVHNKALGNSLKTSKADAVALAQLIADMRGEQVTIEARMVDPGVFAAIAAQEKAMRAP
jgi:hypothetical protein